MGTVVGCRVVYCLRDNAGGFPVIIWSADRPDDATPSVAVVSAAAGRWHAGAVAQQQSVGHAVLSHNDRRIVSHCVHAGDRAVGAAVWLRAAGKSAIGR